MAAGRSASHFPRRAERCPGASTLGPKGLRTGDRHRTKSRRPKTKFWRWPANSPRPANSSLVTAITAEMGGPTMTTGYGNTSLAIKVGYYVLAAGVAVFVAMLILTAYP